MRKTPLLDLGNVIVQVDFTPFLSWLEKKSSLADKKSIPAILRSSLFYDFEFGHISRQEFGARISNLYKAQFYQEELEDQFCSIFPGLVDGMEGFLEELAADGPVHCLSNTNEIHLEYCLKRFPVLSRFHTIFASHQLNKRKPYPGIYVDVANALDLSPAEIIFFDDSHANVEGALRAGMEAHVFAGVSGLRTILKSF
jgi:HAD superfamily hydrolase (TIGR01509 family)